MVHKKKKQQLCASLSALEILDTLLSSAPFTFPTGSNSQHSNTATTTVPQNVTNIATK